MCAARWCGVTADVRLGSGSEAVFTAWLLMGLVMAERDWRLTGGQPFENIHEVESKAWTCGYCGNRVASDKGWKTPSGYGVIRLCGQCNTPTFFSDITKQQWPGPLPRAEVEHLPAEVQRIYEEARRSLTVNAFTGTVMLCRKILMHVAVEKEAETGKRFIEYVKWLVDEHWVPRGGAGWVAYIKDRGNEANHELPAMERDDAERILLFTESLLRNVYELEKALPGAEAEETA